MLHLRGRRRMLSKIKENKNKCIGIACASVIIIVIAIIIYWLHWGRWEHISFQTDFDTIIHQGVSERYDERTFAVIDDNIEGHRISSWDFIYPHYVMSLNYSYRQREIRVYGRTQTLINWRRAEVTIYNIFTMEPVQNIDVLDLMEESGANDRNYQLYYARPRGTYIEGEDLHLEWRLEIDPQGFRPFGSDNPFRGLRFNSDTGYTLLTARPRSTPRLDRLEEKDIDFQVEMSILNWHGGDESIGFMDNNGLEDIEEVGRIRVSYDRFPGVVHISMPASRLPMENETLYSCFPELLNYRGQKNLQVYLVIGGFPTAETISLMLIEEGEVISFEGLVLSTWQSADEEERKIHSFDDYRRFRCRERWERERFYGGFSLEMYFGEYRFSFPTHLDNLKKMGIDFDSVSSRVKIESGEEVFIEKQGTYGWRCLQFLLVNLGKEPRSARDSGVFGLSSEDDWSSHISLNGNIRRGGDATRALWILPTPSASFHGTVWTAWSNRPIIDRYVFLFEGHTILELITKPEENEVVAIHVRTNYDGRDWNEFLEFIKGEVCENLLEAVGAGSLYRWEDFVYFQDGEKPQRILDYVVPRSIDEESEGVIYSFHGDLYTFPTPLQAFVDNGWEIESRLNVLTSQSGSARLIREEDVIWVYIASLEENWIPLEYYHVVKLEQEWNRESLQRWRGLPIYDLDSPVLDLSNVSLRGLRLFDIEPFELFPGDFLEYRPYEIEFNPDSQDVRFILSQIWEYLDWFYDFRVGDTIVRVRYDYSSPYRLYNDILYFKVWSVELIYDKGNVSFPSLESIDTGERIDPSEVLGGMIDVLEDTLEVLEGYDSSND